MRNLITSLGAKVHSSIAAKGIPEMGGGVGVVCKDKPIGEGVRIVTVPVKLMFTSRVARNHPTFSQFCENLVPLQLIPLFLAHELRDPKSMWYPWVSKLPDSYDTLIEASNEEIELLAIHPRRYKKVIEERASVEKLYKQMIATISKVQLTNSSDIATERLEQLKRIGLDEYIKFYCSLLSRGFYYDVDRAANDIWTMIPFADYFNYTDGTGHIAQFNKNKQYFEVITTSTVTPDSQILLHYGTYSNFELLLWYGFVLKNNRNAEYKLSPHQDANGMVQASEDWAVDLIKRIEGSYDWLTSKVINVFIDQLPHLRIDSLLDRWSFLPPRGYYKEGGSRRPPRLSDDLKNSVQVLSKFTTSDHSPAFITKRCAQMVSAIAKAELQFWKAEPSSISTPVESFTSQTINFMVNEEYSLIKLVAETPVEVWEESFPC
eukprot:TRINITY_DN2421_c0_g1_i1.p1 TRINITY_DN2421_c0_g1~~TRINITY_DN2421_c0_g1_i1.p1  ORF type:complete len:462 (+),score=86.63 TRINITY_DN2421_c0_g1_i1:88-1386(+)